MTGSPETGGPEPEEPGIEAPECCDARVARLLRWYPASWRARYGEEFAELLHAEFAERHRDWRRAGDVIRGGVLARLSGAGLTSRPLPDPGDQARASLATMSCAAAAFVVFGFSMLGQLSVGWQWAQPAATAAAAGTTIMSVAAAVLAILAVLAVVPVAWRTAFDLIGRRGRKLAWPTGLALAGAAALWTGAHHFQNAWPGTGGTAAQHSLVPGGVAAFSWASTLAVSSYWVHPADLQLFPWPELAWMALSPGALLCLAGGTAAVVRRQRLSRRMLTFEARLAMLAAVAMCGLFAGAACWVFGRDSGQAGLFHAGAVDVAGLAVMTVALAVVLRAGASARLAVRALAAAA